MGLSIAACWGCGSGGSAPAAPTGAGATSASPSSDAPASTAAPSSGTADAPTAKVVGVAVSDKGDHFTRVTVNFENKTSRACTIQSYVVTWGGGNKEFPLDGKLVLAPGESKVRAARVHAGEGDITTLTGPDDTKVDLKSTCK